MFKLVVYRGECDIRPSIRLSLRPHTTPHNSLLTLRIGRRLILTSRGEGGWTGREGDIGKREKEEGDIGKRVELGGIEISPRYRYSIYRVKNIAISISISVFEKYRDMRNNIAINT